MRKSLRIDDNLLAEAKAASGAATDEDAVRLGLEALVRRAAHQSLLALRGSEPKAQDVQRRRTASKAADLVEGEDIPLRQPSGLPAWTIVEQLRENADLAEDEAMKVAVEETLAHRKKKAGKPK